jgi:proline dehydrogenase
MTKSATGRTERFELRMTAEESAALSARAEEAGYKTVSDYARARLIGERSAPPSRRAMSLERAELIRALTRVGERLNLLAHLCAQNDALREESEACLSAVRASIASLA